MVKAENSEGMRKNSEGWSLGGNVRIDLQLEGCLV